MYNVKTLTSIFFTTCISPGSLKTSLRVWNASRCNIIHFGKLIIYSVVDDGIIIAVYNSCSVIFTLFRIICYVTMSLGAYSILTLLTSVYPILFSLSFLWRFHQPSFPKWHLQYLSCYFITFLFLVKATQLAQFIPVNPKPYSSIV